jgi:hypothetical protein
MSGSAERGHHGRLRCGVASAGAALLAAGALLAVVVSHGRRVDAAASTVPMTRDEAVGLARERVAAGRVLGSYLDDGPRGRVWMVEVELDAERRAEVEIDPTARAVVSCAIRTAPDEAPDPVVRRP